MSKHYSFESLQNIFEGYSNFRNKLQEETNKSEDPYPWLEPNDPRRKMTDRKIKESMAALNQSCLSKEEL